jgi:Undecaprenyl-phosphate galactose phosphotransferase WbaP
MTTQLARLPALAPRTTSAPVIEFPAIATARAQRIKRVVDLTLTLIGLLIALPFMALIALAIVLESGQPVFFSQERIGRGGRRFKVRKFRTMVVDADEVLRAYLATNPEARSEWEETRKLRRDPRVTRVGRFLRRASLDELPQLWNVLCGDMSLAGPRPIVEKEVSRYGSGFAFYMLTRPGLTGLWQVSGRNDTTYRKRVELDVQYVRNWSPGLDFSLFLRTFGAVLRGTGAY